MRKLTTALGRLGSTLSLGLPESMVGAVVVWTMAAVAASPMRRSMTMPFVSQRLANAARAVPWSSGPT